MLVEMLETSFCQHFDHSVKPQRLLLLEGETVTLDVQAPVHSQWGTLQYLKNETTGSVPASALERACQKKALMTSSRLPLL